MGGGGGASANNEITFNDTSEYIYRNSSEKSGGGTIEAGTVRENRDRNTDISEDITDQSTALDQACRDQIKGMVTTLEAQVTSLAQDTTDVQGLAQVVWDSALSLHDDVDAKLTDRLDDLKAETLNRIMSYELQWQRTAGSSLNCIVLDMTNKATTEMARRMSAVAAEMLFQAQGAQQDAIHTAFQDQMTARSQPRQLAFGHMGTLLGVLKGSLVDTTRNRDVLESMDENASQTKLMSNLFYSAKSVADNSGQYAGDADDFAAAARALQP